MNQVVDASVVVAALVDSGADGRWAEEQLLAAAAWAPELMPVETTNVLRRLEAASVIDPVTSGLAFRDLLRLAWRSVGFEPCAQRIWELRGNLTAYDAWYVAAAELLGVPLVTLDERLARAPGLRCEVRSPAC